MYYTMNINKIINISRYNFFYHADVTFKRCYSKIIRRSGKGQFMKARVESTIQEDLFANALVKIKNNKQQIDWAKLKSDIISTGTAVNNVNFDAMFIGFCGAQKDLNVAKSYLDFLYSNNQKPNLAAIGKFFRLYYLCSDDIKISEKDEQLLLNIYDDLKKSYPLLDSVTGENVISGLSVTSKWKEALGLLDTVKITTNPSGIAYSAIARAAFLNKEDKLGWDLLDESIFNNRFPHFNVYSAWIKTCKEEKGNKLKRIEHLLNFFVDNEIFPTKQLCDEILEVFNSLGYKGTYTTIVKRGYCNVCKNNLQKVTVSKENFEELKTTFFNKVIVGKNIFNKTTPEELEKFKNFISKNAPYDIVIDGLNVAYSAGVKQSPHVYGKMLISVIDHFDSKKVLVLGRAHMTKWPKYIMKKIESKADVFLAHDISQDDPYLLYATMASGFGAGFVSRDLMRSHAYLLMDNNLRRVFRRWQQLHQYTVIHVHDNGKVTMKYPYTNLSTTQRHKSGWHIPYELSSNSEYSSISSTHMEPMKNWLCINSL